MMFLKMVPPSVCGHWIASEISLSVANGVMAQCENIIFWAFSAAVADAAAVAN